MGIFPSKVDYSKDNDTNIVYLYQFPRWALGPNQSAPCLRVEAFLRLHRIPHVIVPNLTTSCPTTGRWPWIRYNGQNIGDSQIIIEFLIKELGLYTKEGKGINTFTAVGDAFDDPNLTPLQRGTAVAVERMLDFHVLPFSTRWTWVDNFAFIRQYSPVKVGGPAFISGMVQSKVRTTKINVLNMGGWGDYSNAEYREQWVRDVEAIAQILSDNAGADDGGSLNTKLFLFGDRPTRTDVSVFAFLHAAYHMPVEYAYRPMRALLQSPDSPLNAYMGRLEALLFPDTDAVCARAGSFEREVWAPVSSSNALPALAAE